MASKMKYGDFRMHEDCSKQVIQLQPDGVRSVTRAKSGVAMRHSSPRFNNSSKRAP